MARGKTRYVALASVRQGWSAWLLGAVLLLPWEAQGAFPFRALVAPDSTQSVFRQVELLSASQRPWRLCAILPNPRDSYWALVRYGLQEQAAALGLKLTLIEASGYESLQQQASLIEKRCLGGAHDALILAAVDHSGLNEQVRRARESGLVVIDLINGISAPEVSSRVAVNYGDLAYDLGRFMVQQLDSGRVLWSPGPRGSVWTLDASAGFLRAVQGSSLTLVHSFLAAPFIRDQRRLLRELADQLSFDQVAGTAVTAEAAVTLRDHLGKEIAVFSYYYSPNIHPLLGCGQIRAAVYEYPALQARVAVDQAVRILEGQPYDFQLSSERLLLTRHNLDQILDPFHMPAAMIRQLSRSACAD